MRKQKLEVGSQNKDFRLVAPDSPQKMSLPFVQHNSGFVPSDEGKEPMPLPDVLGGTALVSHSGRVYHLFGNEEKAFAIPDIPAIPESLTTLKPFAVTLEEALQQIETFASPTKENKTSEQQKPSLVLRTAEQSYLPDSSSSVGNTPTIQLRQALGESVVSERHVAAGIPLKLINNETIPSNAVFSIENVVREVSPTLPIPVPKLNDEKRKTLRVVPGHIEEPFVVPYFKPETVSREVKMKNATLHIVERKGITEYALSPKMLNCQHFTKILKKCGLRRRIEGVLHRKRFSLPPVSTVPVTQPLVASEPKPPVDPTMFQWSDQLDSLMQTAGNQIQMLTDHLVVQLSQGTKEICFKSVFPGDGCSTIMLCAARALTERNYRILLIDSHHRHIDLPRQLNLSGNLDTGTEVIALNNRLGLWVWQETKTIKENENLLAEVVKNYRSEYDLILVDDGSVTESPLVEFITFWNRVVLSGVVLVSNIKRSSELPISHIAQRFRQHRVSLIGIAENYV